MDTYASEMIKLLTEIAYTKHKKTPNKKNTQIKNKMKSMKK